MIVTIIAGFIGGMLARLIIPGNKSVGAFAIGGFLGLVGWVLTSVAGQAVGWFQPGEGAGLVGALVGALLLVGVWELIARAIKGQRGVERDEPRDRVHPRAAAEPVLAKPPEQTASATVERLEKLAALRASGALDEEEFQRLKAKALKNI